MKEKRNEKLIYQINEIKVYYDGLNFIIDTPEKTSYFATLQGAIKELREVFIGKKLKSHSEFKSLSELLELLKESQKEFE